VKIVHVINSLNDGGAEAVLYRLCSHDRRNQHIVVSLSDKGKYGEILSKIGIQVEVIRFPSFWSAPSALLNLVTSLRSFKPDVVQTWMYHSNLIGGFAAWIAGNKTIFWGVHNTTLKFGKSKTSTIVLVRVSAYLSYWLPSRIVACAQSALVMHQRIGYSSVKLRFIPNGYDLTEFKCLLSEGFNLRASLRIPPDTPLIGCVARYDPQKDHANLLCALAFLRSWGVSFFCILVGRNMDHTNIELSAQVKDLGLRDQIMLLGPRDDIPALMSAFDVHILSSSYGEAFPNVIAEAMACETPCIATDVGDAAAMIGDCGWIVPPADAEALAVAINNALLEVNTLSWQIRCSAARRRILDSYSVEKMVLAYEQHWREAVEASSA